MGSSVVVSSCHLLSRHKRRGSEASKVIRGRSQAYVVASAEVTKFTAFEDLLATAYKAYREDPIYVVEIAEASKDVVRQSKERLGVL